ncbi:MAG: hypothetical protein QMD92_01255 [bacterium]|nr:hypothetical protein [bacterium]
MKRNNSLKVFMVILILILLYSFVIKITPTGTTYGVDNGLKFIQTLSFIEKNFSDFSLFYPCYDIDKDYKYYPVKKDFLLKRGGKLYAVYPPFWIFISALFFKVFSYFGLYLVPLISSILTSFLLYLIFEIITERKGVGIVLLSELCTPLFFYGVCFWFL